MALPPAVDGGGLVRRSVVEEDAHVDIVGTGRRDGRQALRMFTELLPDRVRVLGADHPDTLAVREWIRYDEDRQGG